MNKVSNNLDNYSSTGIEIEYFKYHQYFASIKLQLYLEILRFCVDVACKVSKYRTECFAANR